MTVFAIASEIELRRVRRMIGVCRVEFHGGMKFFFGTMHDRDVCLVKTGVGRKHAAAAARKICSVVQPDRVIIAGAAGALDPGLGLGAVVVVESIVRENNHEEILCSGEWSRQTCALLRAAGMRVLIGRCWQAGTFVHRAADKQALYVKTGAQVVDMESAAFGYELQRAGVPFVNVRIVSDTAGRDTADMASIVGLRYRLGRMAALLWLCLRPRELMRVWFFYRGMGIAAVCIADVLSILMRTNIGPSGTGRPAAG